MIPFSALGRLVLQYLVIPGDSPVIPGDSLDFGDSLSERVIPGTEESSL